MPSKSWIADAPAANRSLVLRLVLLAAGASLCALLAGCATVEQQGVIPTPPPPIAAPRTVGVDRLTDDEHRRLVAQFGGEYRWPAAEAYLNAILVKLAAASDSGAQTYRVTLLNTPVVNAFALPSGNLYVSRGLLALAQDSAEIAAVMAHEIAHVSARHAAARAEREKSAVVLTRAAEVIQSKQKWEQVEATQKLSFAGFSRQQEIDADRIGVNVIAKAGYDPYGAARFLAALGRSTALREAILGQKSDGRPDILATHPSTPERIAQATQAARQIGAPGFGEADRAGYLAAIKGVAFGPDPSEGVTRGRKFVQPRVGVAFTAPDGFVLDNTPRALLGKGAGGREALRLDSIVVAQTTTLESYLTSGWLDGFLASSLEPLTVNGMPAATGVARADEWNFRVAVIRRGSDVYRLMFAAKALDEPTERRFKEAIQSFRPVSPEDLALARPLRLAVVNATSSDSVDSLAARMGGVERPAEMFRVLNGIDPGVGLKAGEAYKLVVE
jgi:predicted Zn-dependent protease